MLQISPSLHHWACLQNVLGRISKAGQGSDEERVIKDVQIALAAFTDMVLERIQDDLPAACRLLLVTEVKIVRIIFLRTFCIFCAFVSQGL